MSKCGEVGGGGGGGGGGELIHDHRCAYLTGIRDFVCWVTCPFPFLPRAGWN